VRRACCAAVLIRQDWRLGQEVISSALSRGMPAHDQQRYNGSADILTCPSLPSSVLHRIAYHLAVTANQAKQTTDNQTGTSAVSRHAVGQPSSPSTPACLALRTAGPRSTGLSPAYAGSGSVPFGNTHDVDGRSASIRMKWAERAR
jgi:hypothetical protein